MARPSSSAFARTRPSKIPHGLERASDDVERLVVEEDLDGLIVEAPGLCAVDALQRRVRIKDRSASRRRDAERKLFDGAAQKREVERIP